MAVTLWTSRLPNWSRHLRASAHAACLGELGMGNEILADARLFGFTRKIYRCLQGLWYPYLRAFFETERLRDVSVVAHAIAEAPISADMRRWWDLRGLDDEEEVCTYALSLVGISLQVLLRKDEIRIPVPNPYRCCSRRARFLLLSLLPCVSFGTRVRGTVRFEGTSE